MKIELLSILSLAFLLILFSNVSSAQNPIPNPGFEGWSGNIPNGWSAPTNNPLAGIEPITKSPEAYSDSWAVRGFVLDFFGVPISPVLYPGTPTDPYFPITTNHEVFSCFYKYFGAEGDMLFIEIVFINLSVAGGAEGHAEVSINNTSIYEKLEIQMEYDNNNPPDWQATIANISVTIKPQEGQAVHPGTWFLLDHFTFDDLPVITDIKEIDNQQFPDKFMLEQNFPNPFNPATKISFSLPEEAFTNLKVYNIQGEEVATLVNERLSAGTYNTDWKAASNPSGVYVYVLRVNDVILSQKMILAK